jgi:hypothetical protein
MSHIFVSYAHEDAHLLDVLHEQLTGAGFAVRSDRDLIPGGKWREEIEKMIRESFAVILVMTPKARDSAYVSFEWAFAQGTGVRVIPLLFESTKFKEPLASIQYSDFTSPAAQPWEHLIKTLRYEEQVSMLNEQHAYRVHRYTGKWKVENGFSLWRGEEITGGDTVYWRGDSYLFLTPDGKQGNGAQIGKLFVNIGSYSATFKNANMIERAHISEDGLLHLFPSVLYWECETSNGELPPNSKFAQRLRGSGEYDIELQLASDAPMVLQGPHRYKMANKIYQLAEERHEYTGF